MVLGAIEKANQRSLGCEVTSYVFPPYTSSPKVGDLETIVVAQNTNFSTTICFDSNNLTRHEQYSYLKDNGLDFTDRWILAIAAALYRFEYGFPPSVFDIGTSRGKGDLFNGYVIRDYSGTLKYENGIHYQCGLHESDYYQDGHRRDRKVIAAGSPARIAKLLFDPFCW